MTNNRFRIHKHTALLAVAASMFLAGLAFLVFLQDPPLGRRKLLLGAALWMVLIPLVYLFLHRFYLPHLRQASARQRFWIASVSLVGGLLAIFVLPVSRTDNLYLYPRHTLEIRVPPGAMSAGAIFELRWFHTDYGDVSFAQFTQEGAWQREGDVLALQGGAGGLAWQGRAGSEAVLTFTPQPGGGAVSVAWDGQLQQVNLDVPGEVVVVRQTFGVPWYNWLSSGLLLWGGLNILFAMVFGGLATRTGEVGGYDTHATGVGGGGGYNTRPARRRLGWLLYALPMVLVWVLWLLVFWPGMMSEDSVSQWMQILSGQYNDWHPVFHTLSIWLLTRMWFTPAIVGIFQIPLLSFVVAWGLGELDNWGAPPAALWVLSALFALSPVNAILSVTLWKDVPYAISLLVLSIILLKLVRSQGVWMEGKSRWVLVGLVAAFVSLFRLNGPPVALATLLFLLVVYRRFWLRWLGSIVILVALWAGVQGPLYGWLEVERVSSGNGSTLIAHHIAAYVDADVALTPAEEHLLGSVLPLDQWKYDCTSLMPMLSVSFDYRALENGSIEMVQTLLALVRRDPWVFIQHRLCASSPVWQIRSYGILFATTFYRDEAGTPRWIRANPVGLQEDSRLPFMVPALSWFYLSTKGASFDIPFLLLWRPALFLYLGIFCVLVAAVRREDVKVLYLAVPLLLQAGLMLVINSAPDFRYHYGVYLIGLFFLGLLFIGNRPVVAAQPDKDRENSK